MPSSLSSAPKPADGTAKPAAVALHNMTSWLADPGTLPFTPGTLDYTLRGAPPSMIGSVSAR